MNLKKSILLFFVLFLSFSIVNSQKDYTCPEGFSDVNFFNLKEHGVLATSRADKSNDKRRQMNFDFLDSNFKIQESNNLATQISTLCVDTLYTKNTFYIILKNDPAVLFFGYSIIAIDLKTKDISIQPIKGGPNYLGYQVKFEALDEFIYYSEENKMLKILNTKTKTTKTINFENETSFQDFGRIKGSNEFFCEVLIKLGKKDYQRYVIGLDTKGEQIFKYEINCEFGGVLDEISIVKTNGSYLFSGISNIKNNFTQDAYWITKFKNGEEIFSKTHKIETLFSSSSLTISKNTNTHLKTSQWLNPSELILEENGYMILAEPFNLQSSSGHRFRTFSYALVIKYDLNGEVVWNGVLDYKEVERDATKLNFISISNDSSQDYSFLRIANECAEVWRLNPELEVEHEILNLDLSILKNCVLVNKDMTASIFQIEDDNYFIYIALDKKKRVQHPGYKTDKCRSYCIGLTTF